jgi:hypothetical protein
VPYLLDGGKEGIHVDVDNGARTYHEEIALPLP